MNQEETREPSGTSTNTSKSDPLSQLCSDRQAPPRGAPRPRVQDQTAALGGKEGAPLVFPIDAESIRCVCGGGESTEFSLLSS